MMQEPSEKSNEGRDQQKDNNNHDPDPPNDATNSMVGNLWASADRLGNVQFRCLWADCQQRYTSVDRLEDHFDQHLSEYGSNSTNDEADQAATIVCRVQGCHILVTSAEELMRHMKMHIFHAIRLHNGLIVIRNKCPNLSGCNFVATTRLVYQGDPLICEWNSCAESFIDINEFVAHVDQHIYLIPLDQRTDQGHYQCLWNECQAAFKNKAHFKWHIQHHSGDKACACPFCGAFFSHSSRLLEHVVRRQEGDSSFVCHFCQKTFTTEPLLRKHCKRHIKSHQCQYCSLVLISPYDLNRHIQTVHAKVRNHKCEHCGKAFYQSSDLNKHVELHFNDTLHQCAQCGQKFRWSKQLKEHERRQHSKAEDYNPSPYQCHLCTSAFPRGSALSKHLKTLHKQTIPVGFSRFQYKKCQDGFFRLQFKRYTKKMEEDEPLELSDDNDDLSKLN